MACRRAKTRRASSLRPCLTSLSLCLAQARAARQEKLEPIHVTFLRHAAWSSDGMVSFNRVHDETGLPRYGISRAAAKLERRGFGKVKPDERDKRWKRLHITLLGLKCYGRIELAILCYLMTRLRGDEVNAYYALASHIYHAARCLPDSSPVLSRWAFPGPITTASDLKPGQKLLIDFLKEIKRNLEFLESRRRSSQKRGTT